MRPFFVLALMATTLRSVNADPTPPIDLPGLTVRAEAQVDREGVFLDQVAQATDARPLPHLRLLDSPAPGMPVVLERARLLALLDAAHVTVIPTNCAGADATRVTRRTRQLEESELRDQLTAALQAGRPGNRGDLEVRFARAWSPTTVPDEPLTLRFADPLPSRLAPRLTVRIECYSGDELVGAWPLMLQLRLWREIWIARTTLRRGDTLEEGRLARERRDVLLLNDTVDELPADLPALEVAEFVAANTPMAPRQLRLRPVMRRGQNADAVLEDGPLQLVLRVEVLEDGAPSQVIRVRNAASRRELRGIVENEKTIRICL